MKYRILDLTELEAFEKEFIDFLVINGIVATDWEKLKKEDKKRSQQIIEHFSDVIFEGVLRKVKYLELRTDKYISAIQCLESKMINVAITSVDSIKSFSKLTSFDGLDIHQLEKVYQEKRELEIFRLTEKGYQISEGDLFKKIALARLKD